MNTVLQHAILTLLAGPNDRAPSLNISRFGVRDWFTVFPWTDSSGTTLYLYSALKATGLDSVISGAARIRMLQNAEDNRSRNLEMLEHFHQINRAFIDAGIKFCGHKGFTVVPEFCEDVALRHQADLDFIIRREDSTGAAKLLESFGYRVVRAEDHEWLLKTSSDSLPKRQDLFKSKAQRTIEFHFNLGNSTAEAFSADAVLSRSVWRDVGGAAVPTLSAADQFIDQTGHFFKHLQSEWTRLSWLLELNRWVRNHDDDWQTWQQIISQTSSCRRSRLAIGASLLMIESICDYSPRSIVAKHFIAGVPPGVKRWVEEFGKSAMLAEFPGTKLYLLLLHECEGDAARPVARKRLAPLHRPPMVVTPNGGWSLRNYVEQISFIFFRMRFHAREGFRFWRANRTWQAAPKS